jgi:hypothetical protein
MNVLRPCDVIPLGSWGALSGSGERRWTPMFGIHINKHNETIRKGFDRQPLAGVQAHVDSAGDIDRRLSLTRTAGGALIAGPIGAVLGGLAKKKKKKKKKKKNTRQLFLIVEGPTFAWAEEIELTGHKHADKKLEADARKFAAKITTAGKKAATAAAQPVVHG